MKKLWIVSMAAVLAVLLSACGAGNVGGSSSGSASSGTASQASSAISSKVEQTGVEDSLSGLQKYLVGNASVTGTPETMRADVIGAKSGVRYKYSRNGKDNVTLELYEYDLSNLNASAQKVISNVKSSGQFTLMDQTVSAVLSDSGKYLMIYKDSATGSANTTYAQQVKKLFQEFKK